MLFIIIIYGARNWKINSRELHKTVGPAICLMDLNLNLKKIDLNNSPSCLWSKSEDKFSIKKFISFEILMIDLQKIKLSRLHFEHACVYNIITNIAVDHLDIITEIASCKTSCGMLSMTHLNQNSKLKSA